MGDSVAMASCCLIPDAPRNCAQGLESMAGRRIAAFLQVPDLDRALSASGKKDAAVELVESKTAHSSCLRANPVRGLVRCCWRWDWRGVAMESVLWRWRKGTKQARRHGLSEILGTDVSRLSSD